MNRWTTFALMVTVSLANCAWGTVESAATTRGARVLSQAEARAAGVLVRLESLVVRVEYRGPVDRPYHGLSMSVPALGVLKENVWHPAVRMTGEDGRRVVRHLILAGYFDRAATPNEGKGLGGRGYSVVVRTGAEHYVEDLGWDLNTIGRLEGLREVVPEGARAGMDKVLARLRENRGEWEARARAIEVAKKEVEAREDWAGRAVYSARRVGEEWSVLVTRVEAGREGIRAFAPGRNRVVMVDGEGRVTRYVLGR
jgi:hypothetical protein